MKWIVLLCVLTFVPRAVGQVVCIGECKDYCYKIETISPNLVLSSNHGPSATLRWRCCSYPPFLAIEFCRLTSHPWQVCGKFGASAP